MLSAVTSLLMLFASAVALNDKHHLVVVRLLALPSIPHGQELEHLIGNVSSLSNGQVLQAKSYSYSQQMTKLLLLVQRSSCLTACQGQIKLLASIQPTPHKTLQISHGLVHSDINRFRFSVLHSDERRRSLLITMVSDPVRRCLTIVGSTTGDILAHARQLCRNAQWRGLRPSGSGGDFERPTTPLRILSQYFFVLVADAFVESLVVLQLSLGLSIRDITPNPPTTERNFDHSFRPPEALMTAIRAMNDLDQEMYVLGKMALQVRARAFGGTYSNPLAAARGLRSAWTL